MKNLLAFPLAMALLLAACDKPADSSTGSASSTAPETTESSVPASKGPELKEIPANTNFTVLKEAEGDLDKDGEAEKVVVYETTDEGDGGLEREIQVHKKQDGKWKLWYKTRGPVLGSMSGGMMGDPFDDISIERGCIVVKHFGGSADKWAYTHRFRYQNDGWELIGASVYLTYFYESQDFDYNLSTGDVVYTSKDEDPERKVEPVEKKFRQKPDAPIKMDGFVPGDRQLKIADTETVIYF